jgi:hypothetical protein
MDGKYQNDIEELTPLELYNFENIFKLYKDGEYYFYNILKTINFPEKLDDSYYEKYRVKSSMPLTALSFKFYNTTKLWWLIVLCNNINNPVQFITPGTTLKVIIPQFVPMIMDAIKDKLK